MYRRTDCSISAQMLVARASHSRAAARSPSSWACTAFAVAVAWARVMVLSTLNVESKYWAPTFGVSARASIHNSVRRRAVAPGSAASFAW